MATSKKNPRASSKAKASTVKQHSDGISRWAHSVVAAGADRGWSRSDTARYLGVSIGYFNVLLVGGGENQKTLGRAVIEASAKLLGTSVLNVCLQSGMLTLSDLYYETDHETTLKAAYKRMMSDSDLCAHLPSAAEWDGKQPLSERSKYGIALLYELASRNGILEKAEIFAAQ